MEAKELRIGNWVLVENDHETIKAITQTAFLCVLDGKGDGYMQLHKDVYPIPLTEEWLIKFGFKKENNTIYSISDKLSSSEVGKWYFFKNENNSFTPHIKRENKFSWIGKEIKYVHQLQNLYFALTGEELGLQVSPSYI